MSGGRSRVRWGRLQVWLVAGALVASACSQSSGVTSSGLQASDGVATTDDGNFAIDPDVRIVTLPNGLTVYLRHNETPGYNAEMRLVVNAGSVDETTDQAGVAHFLEHMMFNGTTSRPGNELIAQLRDFGMEFGADINAYTSYDETVYQLSMPAGPGESDQDSAVADGLDILSEWLSAATLDPVEVTNEIGVVMDEWRGGQSFSGRLDDAIAGIYLTGSAYADRSPIGTADAIQAMTSERLRAYYDAWYRPDNAAVVVVGDIDVDEVEDQINTLFGGLQPRGTAPARPDSALRSFADPQAAVFIDPDTSVAEVELTLPGIAAPTASPAQLRSQLLDSLAFDMVATRLSDDRARGQASFTDAYGDDNSLVRRLDAPSVVVTAEADGVDAAIDALLTEFERADRFGFSQAELDRSTAAYRAEAVARYDAHDSIGDSDFAERYAQFFLTGDPPLEAATERDALIHVFDSVTPDEVSVAFAARYHAQGSHLLLMAPDTMAASLPTEQALLDRLAARPQMVIEPRVDAAPIDDELMARPEAVVESSSDEMAKDPYSFLDPVELTFANGAHVVLNPSDIVDDQVVLSAVSPGGLSLVADADVPDALAAVQVVSASGLGSLDPVALDTKLSATSVEVYPSIDISTEAFIGSSTTHDAETLLQVIALYMTQPRFDQAALDSTVDSWRPYVDDPNGDPDLAVYAAYNKIRFGDEPRFAIIPTAADLDALDLPAIERVWRDRFSSPGDWSFAISGDFDVDEMTELVRSYIGSLPDDKRAPETAVDMQPAPPDGVVTKDVLAGSGQKATLTRVYDAPAVANEVPRDLVLADLVTGIISNRLTDSVREKMGASYSPYGYSTVYTTPDLLVETIIDVTGDPDGIDDLTSLVSTELDDLRSKGPSEGEFDDALTALQQSYDQFSDETLVDVLVHAASDPDVLDEFIGRRDTLDDIDLSAVRSFIQRVLPADRYIEMRLLPA